MKAFFCVLCMSVIICNVPAGSISLVADTTPPDPNDEITVWVHTDSPLLFMELDAYVTGDATITSAMSEADCNEFGWENGWGFEPIIDDPNGWVSIGGINWAADANDIVGYFKFRYNSGQVAVYIDQENSLAANWGNNFTFSTEALLFGEMVLPPLQEPNEPTPVLVQCPLGSGGPPRGGSEDFSGWSQELGRGMDELDSEPNIVEINSDITTNQIWDANNVYYVTAEAVNVQALLVIEPNTLVIFGYGCALFVNNGGTLISRGTPDQPIVYTSDLMYFDYPEYIGYYWQVMPSWGPQYYYPVYIQETASSATTFTYCFVEGALKGIVTDNIHLDNPIENNYFFGNIYGIFESGPKLTDIRNNLCFYNDQSGIEVHLADMNGVSDANSVVTIENNTCDGGGWACWGVTVHGVADANEIPTVNLLNNIVSESYPDAGYYGLNLGGGPMWLLIANTGYFGNAANKNDENIVEYNPVEVAEFPYTPGEMFYQTHYLAQDCNFINAGTDYIEQTPLIGMTTDVNSLPDCNFIDIGFHYPNWDYSGASPVFAETDFNKDGSVNVDDLLVITDHWLDTDPNTNSIADLDCNSIVNMRDFSIFAASWQTVTEEPNIVPVISGDPNSGWIDIGASGFTPNTQRVFILADGKYAGEIFGFRSGDTYGMDISEFGGQTHQLKLVATDLNGQILCSGTTEATFPSTLNYCILPHSYEPNEPLHFAAYNTGTGNATVKVYANGGDLVWSQGYSGNTVIGSIPADITNDYEIDYVSFDPDGGTSIAKITSANVSSISGDIKALIILPDPAIRKADTKQIATVQNAFKKRGIKYVTLGEKSATYSIIAGYARFCPIKYMYIDGHGNYQLVENGVLRTCIQLSDGIVVSMKESDFLPGQAPAWCERLEGHLEDTTRSFFSMGFNNLEFVYADCCYSGRLKINAAGQLVEGQPGQLGIAFDGPHSDMSLALGIGNTSESRAYQGWYDVAPIGPWWWENAYQKWTRHEWERLGEGDHLYDAIMYVIDHQTEFGDDDPINNYRLKGQGYTVTLRLHSN